MRAAPEGLWDRLGCWASSACVVHCLVSPLFLLALPSFGRIWAHPASHALMALGVVPLGATVLIHGSRGGGRRWIRGAALAGILFVFAGSALPYLPSAPTSLAEEGADSCDNCCPSVVVDESGERSLHLPPATIATILGSACLITAHLGNRRRVCIRCTGA
ncbi:MAG: MerC domain-containing protein [Planctomycetota bacterium]